MPKPPSLIVVRLAVEGRRYLRVDLLFSRIAQLDKFNVVNLLVVDDEVRVIWLQLFGFFEVVGLRQASDTAKS